MRALQLIINAANPVPELCSIFEAYPRQIFGCLYIQNKNERQWSCQSLFYHTFVL